ncbi:MAG: DUF3291 domain-containing protein [Gammaproteobacteria bacterium]|nr:DUF3291 domain-containing protein [Gammaproteobacteria bacterium]
MPHYHLAQANVARMRAAMDDPRMQGFVARLEPLNEIADTSPGFVWRYETAEGDTTEAEVFEDELILFNMSVWESVEALEQYAYRSQHVEAVQRRAEWFQRMDKSPLVLWWIAAGHLPTVLEARQRFDKLWQDGPSAEAFTFRHRYPPPAVPKSAP